MSGAEGMEDGQQKEKIIINFINNLEEKDIEEILDKLKELDV